MKNYIITSLLFLLLGCSQNEYNIDDIIRTDNSPTTEKFSNEPITGKVYKNFGEKDNLKKVYMGNLLNGKEEGLWTFWSESGLKILEVTYNDGKLEGLITSWYEDGRKQSEQHFKDGKENGLHTKWYELNGKKQSEQHFKDGKLDGLYIDWYDNGQKSYEGVYKEGKVIDFKVWKSDGSVRE